MYSERLDSLDLDGYLARIGYDGALEPTADVLRGLHFAHACSVPFENLDIQLGRPILLDLPSLQDKLVRRRRGGYCFEQNSLMAAVLERLGFEVTALAARVRFGAASLLPRTHMILKVRAGAKFFLADVGFGAEALLMPQPWVLGREVAVGHRTFRLLSDGPATVLQSRRAGEWHDLYAFTEEPQHPVDFEVANYYTSTYPASRFVVTLIAQRATPKARFVLRNREFTIMEGDQTTTRELASNEELLAVLADPIGLDFPPGTRFKSL
ncbi:MAG: arylamine N-acetyltransferase [Planctomycetes bacterium]|nr:arylamine N-acetyltransferase [Planctomycetota bacterium]